LNIEGLRPETSALFYFKMSNLKSKITAIKAGRNPKIQRSNIYLDGKFAFSLDNEVIAKESLKTGLELSPEEINLLTGADRFQRCLNAAFLFLSYRPRSEAETRQRLLRRGYAEEEVEKVITQLSKLDLLNDTAFAEFWKENRNSFRPRSQKMLKVELKRKGVETGIIDEVVSEVDDAESAYRAAMSKASHLPVSDYQVFRQRLGSYLQRRGFNYGIINKIVKEAWQEITKSAEPQFDITEEVSNTE
jgi:regulatory protein